MKAIISVISMLCAIYIGSAFLMPIHAEASMDGLDYSYKVEAEGVEKPVQAYHDADGDVQLVVIDQEQIAPYLEQNSLEYYAYMDLNTVETDLIPVVLEARYQIIFAEGWVADEIDGWILDENGDVIEVLPHFHEIFPADWEVPCFPPEYNQK